MGLTPNWNNMGNIIQTKSLIMYHQNIRSIKGKKEELVNFLNDEGNKIYIVCINEHHLSVHELIFSMLENKMATGFSCSIFRNGGVCILVKDNILYQVLDLYNLSIEKIFEAWALTISVNKMKLCILCLYRDPNKDLNQLIEQLDSTLLYLESTQLELLICGDTNINATHQLLVYADGVNLLGDNIDTIKEKHRQN
jgi:hypothetical protein